MEIKSLKEKIIDLNKSGRLQASKEAKAMIKRMNKVKRRIESGSNNSYKVSDRQLHSFVRDSGL